MSEMNKCHVYFMPGLAASSKIFEHIKLSDSEYELHYLDWKLPDGDESLESYVKRMLLDVKHENPILVGVSFGGIIIQEMTKYISVQQLIIISSVCSSKEFPTRMHFAKNWKLYKIFPTTLFSNFEYLKHFMLGRHLKKRFEMYKMYMFMNDKKYLDWAFKNVINWEEHNLILPENTIRIHGENDEVFPIQYIDQTNCYIIPKATHAMIVYKYKWFNQNLPIILKQTKYEKSANA